MVYSLVGLVTVCSPRSVAFFVTGVIIGKYRIKVESDADTSRLVVIRLNAET
jgi:hypothetical protein